MPEVTLFDQKIDNRALFSDHFLEERLPDGPKWQEDIDDLYNAVRAKWAQERESLESANEAQTEKDFIRPVLNMLGWESQHDVQAQAKQQGKPNIPDYAFYGSEEDVNHSKAHRDNQAQYFAPSSTTPAPHPD